MILWHHIHQIGFNKLLSSHISPNPVWLHSHAEMGQTQEVFNIAFRSKSGDHIRQIVLLAFEVDIFVSVLNYIVAKTFF